MVYCHGVSVQGVSVSVMRDVERRLRGIRMVVFRWFGNGVLIQVLGNSSRGQF